MIGRGVGATSSGPAPTDTPQPNADARAIVQEFLRANVAEPLDPRGTHEFLTPELQRKWSDQTVTILKGSAQDADVGLSGAGNPPHAVAVEVTGIQLGSLAADGTYTPVPVGTGGAGQPWSYQFGLDPINSQFRISDAPDGLIVYADDFLKAYQPSSLYFLDPGNTHLVPDVRYSALQSPQALASWRLAQLLAGPRAQLNNAVRTEVPSLPASARPSVTVNGAQVVVEIPGSSHLDRDAMVRLTAQLLATLGGGPSSEITDGGVSIGIPDLSSTPTDIAKAPQPPTGNLGRLLNSQAPTPTAFYLDHLGRLVTADGQPVPGPLATGVNDLSSVAVAADRAGSPYYVAACVGSGSGQTLWLGRSDTGLHKTAIPAGQLTRPSWVPGLRAADAEVWIANGPDVFRVGQSGWSARVPTTLAGGRILALRLSPEGSRVAMIVQGVSGGSQVWVGSVVRTGTPPNDSVRIDSAQPITPAGYHLTDVAWGDDITLWAIGTGGHRNGIWSVNADGANFRERSSAGLPQLQQVDSIATAPNVLQWVSVGGYVFELGATGWEGPSHHTTSGRSPTYLVYLN